MNDILGKVFAYKSLGIKAGIITRKRLFVTRNEYEMLVLSSTSSYKRFFIVVVDKNELSDADKKEYEDDMIYNLIKNYQFDRKFEMSTSYNNPFVLNGNWAVLCNMISLMRTYKYDSLKQYISLFHSRYKNITIYKIL